MANSHVRLMTGIFCILQSLINLCIFGRKFSFTPNQGAATQHGKQSFIFFSSTHNIRFFSPYAILAAYLLKQENTATLLRHGVYCMVTTEACCGLGDAWLTTIGRHMVLLLSLAFLCRFFLFHSFLYFAVYFSHLSFWNLICILLQELYHTFSCLT